VYSGPEWIGQALPSVQPTDGWIGGHECLPQSLRRMPDLEVDPMEDEDSDIAHDDPCGEEVEEDDGEWD